MPFLTVSINYGNNGFSQPSTETRKMKVKGYSERKKQFAYRLYNYPCRRSRVYKWLELLGS